MPRAKETLRVDVNESTTDETRTITVTITAPAQEFLLADLLRQRGAVGSIDAPLKAAVREILQSYIESAEDLVAGIAAGQRRGVAAAKPKAKEAMNGRAEGAEPMTTGNGRATQNSLQSYEAQEERDGATGDVLSLQ